MVAFRIDRKRLGDNTMKTENLYLDSAFGDWLRQCPANVEHNYSELNVDLHGTRVSVCFSVPDEQETTK